MRRIAAIALLLFLSGCANRQLSPGMEKITSVTDTTNCKFIKNMYTETQARNMVHYLQLNTGNAGGDSYKIISTNDEKVGGINVIMVNFEVYKCNK